MKKTLIIGTLIGVIALALGAAGFAYAQSQIPQQPFYNGSGMGYMHGNGRGGGMMGYSRGEGPLHDYMMAELAAIFDLTPEEFEERHEAGETLWDFAQEAGIGSEELQNLVLEARTNALNKAVADGVITQEQADWMLSRMSQAWANGYGPGSENCDGSGSHGHGYSGRGGRWNSQPNQ